MPACELCGQDIPAGARACPVCGTERAGLPTAEGVAGPADRGRTLVLSALAPGQRYCPACERVYDADYADSFCACGVELVPAPVAAEELPPMATVLPDLPPPGTPCLVLYGPDKQPRQYFALTKDVTLIGRLDPAAGCFPEIDLDEWLDRKEARRISRQHALVLRHRADGSFRLRPLAGNTGTQIEADMVPPLGDYPLAPGCRLVLGGVARLKFETA